MQFLGRIGRQRHQVPRLIVAVSNWVRVVMLKFRCKFGELTYLQFICCRRCTVLRCRAGEWLRLVQRECQIEGLVQIIAVLVFSPQNFRSETSVAKEMINECRFEVFREFKLTRSNRLHQYEVNPSLQLCSQVCTRLASPKVASHKVCLRRHQHIFYIQN